MFNGLGRGSRSQPSLDHNQLYRFTINLELMLASGIGLGQSLAVFARSNDSDDSDDSALAVVSDRLHASVSAGRYLSEAMAQQPRSFPKSFCRLIRSGEVSGSLVECLRRSAETQQKSLELIRTLKKATIYPSILLISSVMMITLMLYLVFPTMLKITGEVGVEPPALTKLVMSLSSPRILGLAALIIFALAVTLEWELRNPASGERVRVFLESQTPPGRFFVLSQMSTSLRQLALMVETGTDLLSALRLAKQVGARSVLVERAYGDIEKQVKDGQHLSEGFAEHTVFPSLLSAMVKVAEEAGDLDAMLYRFCDIIDDEMQSKVTTFTAVLEPLLMGAMGFVVGTILLAAFLPIYQLVAV